MKNNFSNTELKNIQEKIPEINGNISNPMLSDFVFSLSDLVNRSKYSIALVCLTDAYYRLNASKISLINAYTHKIWYQELSPQAPQEIESIYYSKFYLDYIPLLLYAIQEDISDFIVNFFNITDELRGWLKSDEGKKKTADKRVFSKSGKVGLYLHTNLPHDQITKVTLKLVKNDSWNKIISYRNSWVHEKPPIINGLGIQYQRKDRIAESENRVRRLGIGTSSEANYSIDDLFDFVKSGFEQAVVYFNEIVGIVNSREEEIIKDFSNLGLQIKLVRNESFLKE